MSRSPIHHLYITRIKSASLKPTFSIIILRSLCTFSFPINNCIFNTFVIYYINSCNPETISKNIQHVSLYTCTGTCSCKLFWDLESENKSIIDKEKIRTGSVIIKYREKDEFLHEILKVYTFNCYKGAAVLFINIFQCRKSASSLFYQNPEKQMWKLLVMNLC